jgi:hypothetical protein
MIRDDPGAVEAVTFAQTAVASALCAALVTACGGSPASPTPADCRSAGCAAGQICLPAGGTYECRAGTFTVTGTAASTFGAGALAPYTATATLAQVSSTSDGDRYTLTTILGQQVLDFQGPLIQIPRQIDLYVNKDATLDFDAIPSSYPFDVAHYQEVSLGIGSPYPIGGTPVNRGASVRLRPGVVPRVIAVRTDTVPASYYEAIDLARAAFGMFTRGQLTSSMVYVDVEPSQLLEGDVVVVFRASGYFLAATSTTTNGFDLIHSEIHVMPDPHLDPLYLQKLLEHEFGHAIGLDHASDTTSRMFYTDVMHTTINKATADDGELKYRRSAGHELTADMDRTSVSAAGPAGLERGSLTRTVIVCATPLNDPGSR